MCSSDLVEVQQNGFRACRARQGQRQQNSLQAEHGLPPEMRGPSPPVPGRSDPGRSRLSGSGVCLQRVCMQRRRATAGRSRRAGLWKRDGDLPVTTVSRGSCRARRSARAGFLSGSGRTPRGLDNGGQCDPVRTPFLVTLPASRGRLGLTVAAFCAGSLYAAIATWPFSAPEAKKTGPPPPIVRAGAAHYTDGSYRSVAIRDY